MVVKARVAWRMRVKRSQRMTEEPVGFSECEREWLRDVEIPPSGQVRPKRVAVDVIG